MDPDFRVRLAAIDHLGALQIRYDDLIPRQEILKNLVVDKTMVPLASSKASSYPHQVDQRNLLDAGRAQCAVVGTFDRAFSVAVAPSVYALSAPVFVVQDMPAQRAVLVQIGSRATDLTPAGVCSDAAVRRYALGEARYRLHQHQFRFSVLAAYQQRCTICALKERSLLQAAHIVDDSHVLGQPSVRNGLSLCAIHHLAYDRHVLGIDPAGTVHIAPRLLDEEDGPMLRQGLQGFHLERISMPRRPQDRPDPERLRLHYEGFLAA